MNVLHIITTIDVGGAEKQLLILTAEQVRQGKSVSVVYLKGRAELKADFENFGVQVISVLANKNPIYQLYLLKKLITMNLDVVHCHLPRAEVLCNLAKKSNVPVIISRHYGDKFFPEAKPWISRTLSRFSTRNASMIIAISESVREYLIDSKEVNKVPIEVINYAFSKSEFRNSCSVKKRSLENPVIGVVSRLSKEKRIDKAIEIFSNFLTECPGAILKICGEGAELNFLQGIVKSKKLDGRIEFLGKQKNIQKYFSSFDILLHTSDFEGFGMVYLEAMSFNLPIVYLSNSGFMYSFPNVFGTKMIKNFQNPAETNQVILEALNLEVESIEISYEQTLGSFSPEVMESRVSNAYSVCLQQ